MVTRSGILEHSFPVAINQKPVTINQDLKAFIPNDRINEEYVYYYLRSRELNILKNCTKDGTTVASINSDALYAYEIPLPSITQQQRIVEKINKIFSKHDSSVGELQKANIRLDQYRKVILEKAIWGELTKKWREEGSNSSNSKDLIPDLSDYTPPDDDGLPTIPEEWILATFGDVFEVYLGSTPKRSNEDYWGGDVHWISSGEVEFTRIKDSKEKITTAGLESCSTTIHPSNTVLLGIIGQGKTRGRAAILDIEAAHNQNTVAVRPEEVGIPAEYIYYFFMENYERTRRLGSGNQQKALSKTRVENMILPLPPVEEQQQISNIIEQRLSVIQKIEQSIESNLKRSSRLRQSILKRTFEGKLVSQDPTEDLPGLSNEDANLEPGEQKTLSEVTSDVE